MGMRGSFGLKHTHLRLSSLMVYSLALLAACSSDSDASQLQTQEQQATRPAVIPSSTPLPTVLKELGNCEVGPKAQCPGADFGGLDLSELRAFQGHNEARDPADFTDADLEGATFAGANLRAVIFEGANLRNANFRDANLREASFYRADVSGADFTNAILDNADFEDAKLEGAIFCNTTLLDETVNRDGCP